MLFQLVLLYSATHLGDLSHANAIAAALEDPAPTVIDTAAISIQPTPLLTALACREPAADTPAPILLLVVGEQGLAAVARHRVALTRFRAEHPHIPLRIAFSIHQYFHALPEVAHALAIDFLAMPQTALNGHEAAFEKSVTLCPTLGVPTQNPSPADLQAAWDRWGPPLGPDPETKTRLIQGPQMVVLLPGDAPDASGAVRPFTQASADALAAHVLALHTHLGKRHTILVHNGPRTGRYVEKPREGGGPPELVETHRHEYTDTGHAEDSQAAVDPISTHFMSKLSAAGIPTAFFNFVFQHTGKTGSPDFRRVAHSAYNPLLHLVHTGPDNVVVVPAESVSMVSQVPLYPASPNQVILFEPSSMNPQHAAIATAVLEQGHAMRFGAAPGTVEALAPPTPMRADDAHRVAAGLNGLFPKPSARLSCR